MPTSIEGSWIARFVGMVADSSAEGATSGRSTLGSKAASVLGPTSNPAPNRARAIAVFSSTDLHLGARGSLLLDPPPRTPGGAEVGLDAFLKRFSRAEPGDSSDEPAQRLAMLVERHLHRHRELRVMRTRPRDSLERGGC